MFTGIIEAKGTIQKIVKEQTNLHITISSAISNELKIDQSIAHDGVCLTVVELGENTHTVTAIDETLLRSNLEHWTEGSIVNLERAMPSNHRLDGHIVQGHVDKTGVCTNIIDRDGSTYFHFKYEETPMHLLVDKGSVCINGVSLTVVNPLKGEFAVAIIPYTIEHTSFGTLKIGDTVNLEFDIIGKYIARYAKLYMDDQRS